MVAPHFSCNFLATLLCGMSLATVACSEDSPAPSSEGPPNNQTGSELIGTFKLELAAKTETTSILGKVSSGPTPAAQSWDELATSGDCKLDKPKYPFCEPPCG